jgi:EAL domain-containing protein (putative c-di-GMP-specific phosphodiesterase class I)
VNAHRVYYQPIVDLRTGAMVSVEALLPRPLTEETHAIGAQVLEQSCRQLVEWQQIQKSMSGTADSSVAVNISRGLLLDSDITALVADVLRRTALRPADLCLEVTESVFRDGVTDFESKLERLKGAGVRWSIDDFGTGYSLLRLLERFPVRESHRWPVD